MFDSGASELNRPVFNIEVGGARGAQNCTGVTRAVFIHAHARFPLLIGAALGNVREDTRERPLVSIYKCQFTRVNLQPTDKSLVSKPLVCAC